MPVPSKYVWEIITRGLSARKSTSPLIRGLDEILEDDTIKGKVKLRLSINDYTKMCNSEELRELMAVKLNTNVEDLTDYCVRVKGVGEHIDLSEKIFKKISLLDLPLDDLEKINDRFESIRLLKYDLIDWIKSQVRRNKIPLEKEIQKTFTLSANYNAIDYIIAKRIEIQYDNLSQNTNPKAFPILAERIKEEKEERQMLRQMSKKERQRLMDESTDDEKDNHVDWKALSQNTNPKVVPLLVERIKDEEKMFKKELKDNHVEWKLLSQNTNPDILPLLVERIEKERQMSKKELKDNHVDWKSLWANINIFKLFKLLEKEASKPTSKLSTDYIKSLKTPNYSGLSANPSDEALTILEANKGMIDYGNLSGNTNLRAIKLLIAKLKESPNDRDIDWSKLSGNSSASEIFKMEKYKSKINWSKLSGNSSDWAIDILKTDPISIDYHNLSGNINRRAIELFYEIKSDLPNFAYGKEINKIDLIYLPNFASNPSIFIEV